MNKHAIDLLDYTDIATLRDGIYARLDQLRATECETRLDRRRNRYLRAEQYLMIAKLDVHFEQATVKSYGHTPLELKLAKAKITAAKITVELKQELVDCQRELYTESIENGE